jgi:hypothetical protein
MMKKTIFTALVALAAVITIPTAANAVGYPDQGNPGTIVAGETFSLAFGGFEPFEATTASSDDAVTLGMISTASSFARPAGASGSVAYSVTASKPGTYTVTVVGAAGSSAAASFTIVPTDAAALPGAGTPGDGLALTGGSIPMPLVWGAGGLVVLGIALLLVLRSRRQHQA